MHIPEDTKGKTSALGTIFLKVLNCQECQIKGMLLYYLLRFLPGLLEVHYSVQYWDLKITLIEWFMTKSTKAYCIIYCTWKSSYLYMLNTYVRKYSIKVVRFLTVCRTHVLACATITATFMVMKSESWSNHTQCYQILYCLLLKLWLPYSDPWSKCNRN